MILKSYKDKDSLDVTQVGGKATNLSWLCQRGYNVPEWRVLPVDYFIYNKNICDKNTGIKEEITSWMDISKISILAVRSSMVGEDSRSSSFAGQLNSYMNLYHTDSILQKIKDCYSSAFTDLNKNYLKRQGLPSDTIRMSVILQEMVVGEKSGVLFTANPSNGCRSEYVISAAFGLGEGIVSGQVDCDEWVLDSSTAQILSMQIAEKKIQVQTQINHEGLQEKEVSKNQKTTATLSNEELKALYNLGLAITKQKGYPQDIEWTIKDGTLYVLQTRDIVALPKENLKIPPLVFDNSNIQESFCGLTLPLTFSFAREAYRQVYAQLMSVVGFSQKNVDKQDRRHRQMLALICGRVYYNINSWYKGLLLLPSFGRNKDDMEKMMGIEDPIDFVVDLETTFWQKLKTLPKISLLMIRVGLKLNRMDTLFTRFRKRFHHSLSSFQKKELFGRSAEELQEIITQAQTSFLKSWDAPVLNDFYVMMSSGKIRRELEKLNMSELYADLLAGENLESINPTKELIRMSDYIKENHHVRILFLKEFDVMSFSRLKEIDNTLFQMVQNYINKYGDRVMGELKLESLSLREDPKFLFQMLSSFSQDKDLCLSAWESNEKERRKKTEQSLKEIMSSLGWYFFKKKLNHLRQSVRFREAMRLDRTRSFGFFRQAYRAMGYALVNKGCLDHLEDIFYLSIEEIEDYLCGQAFFDDPKSLVEMRKKQYQIWGEQEAPHQLKGWAPFSVEISQENSQENQEIEINPKEGLKGLGCFPGVVQGEVVVVHSPDQTCNLKGKILCAMRTDPGWTPLFVQIKGLLVERGSTLSHSAIVAREMGIPTIVGIPQITKILKTGNQVTMDGTQGLVLKERMHEFGTSSESRYEQKTL